MLTEDTNRTKSEEFGYLTVENCVLTGSDVADYYGYEIPDCKNLGLDAKKIYRVYRPLNEIKNSDFSNLPLLSKHADFNAIDYKDKLIIGTIGETKMVGEQLKATVVFWSQDAINDLEKGKKYLSNGYLYDPILESGAFKGQKYDIKMQNIVANHVALVDNPRYKAAIVADEDLTTKKKGILSMFFKKKNKSYTFDQAIDDIKKILASDESESLKEKAVEKIKEKLGKDKKDEEMEKREKEKEAENEMGDLEEAEAEDEEEEELEDLEQEKMEKETGVKSPKKYSKSAAKDAALRRLVADSVAKEISAYHKKATAFDGAIKEFERICGRVNRMAFDGDADKVLTAILKNAGKTVVGKTFEQKQAMVEMLPNATAQKSNLLVIDSAESTDSDVSENILKLINRR